MWNVVSNFRWHPVFLHPDSHPVSLIHLFPDCGTDAARICRRQCVRHSSIQASPRCTGAYFMIIPAYDTQSPSTGVYLTSNLQVLVCFHCRRPSVTHHIKLHGDKRTANPERLCLCWRMQKRINKWQVFTTRGPRAERDQLSVACDPSVMLLEYHDRSFISNVRKWLMACLCVSGDERSGCYRHAVRHRCSAVAWWQHGDRNFSTRLF
jgi:hypothetical protein